MIAATIVWPMMPRLVLMTWLVAATAQAVPPPAGPRLSGTFVQLRADDRWTDQALRGLFLDFRRLGLSRIVVQWTVAGTKAFYPSETFEPVPDPPLERLLTLADDFGIAVRLGLAHDPEFWGKINPPTSPRDLDAYLRVLRRRSTAVLRELLPIAARHRSFEGWFVTEEIDDVNWVLPERRALLRTYLADLRRAARLADARTSVAISGFSNAHCDPATLEAFWRDLLDATGIDQLYFQDGIGAHKLDLPYLAMYLAAVKRAALASGRGVSIVVELFDQVGGPPVADGMFKAQPAGIERLARQIAMASEASTAGILAFSVPDYMLPTAGPAAQQLFDDYLRRVSTEGEPGRSPRVGPANVPATVRDGEDHVPW